MKAAITALALLTAALGLGAWLCALYLRHERKPTVIGAHLLAGAAGIELTVMMLRGSPDGEAVAAATIGTVAAVLLAFAMVSGLATPLIARHCRTSANLMVTAHIALGLAGYAFFLCWLAGS